MPFPLLLLSGNIGGHELDIECFTGIMIKGKEQRAEHAVA
jgi:hypothetical protein